MAMAWSRSSSKVMADPPPLPEACRGRSKDGHAFCFLYSADGGQRKARSIELPRRRGHLAPPGEYAAGARLTMGYTPGQGRRIPYSQNIRTRFPPGGYTPYPRPPLGLSSAPLSPILPVNMDGTGCGGEAMDWKTLLAYITGTVDQELLLRNEYLVTENRILRNQIKGRVRLSDGERKTLAEMGQKLGKQALAEVAKIVKPDTILGWHRQLVAQKFDGSTHRKGPGRPTIDQELEALVVRMAQENRSWGYDRIVGALANLGLTV